MTLTVIAGYLAARTAQNISTTQTLEVAAQKTADGLILNTESLPRLVRSLAESPEVVQFTAGVAGAEGFAVPGETERGRLLEFLERIERQGADRSSTYAIYDESGDVLLSTGASGTLQKLEPEWIEGLSAGTLASVRPGPRNRYEGVVLAPIRLNSDSPPIGYFCEITDITTLLAYTMGYSEVPRDVDSEGVRYQIALAGAEGPYLAISLGEPDPVSENPSVTLAPLSETLRETLRKSGPTGTLSINDYEVGGVSQRVLMAYHALPTFEGFYLLTYLPSSVVYGRINALAIFASAIGTIFIAFLCFNAYRNVHNNIVRPLALLNEGAQIIRQGDLDLKLKIDTQDEIEEVATSFNKMALALSRNIGQLEESERKYRTLVTAIREGLYQTDNDGVITFINPIGAQMIALEDPDDALGMSVRDFFMEDSDYIDFNAELERNGFTERSRLWMKCVDGRTICVAISSNRLFDERGVSIGTEGIYRDVTKSVQLEQEARERSERISAINQIANVINSSLEAGRLYESLVVELKKLVNFDYAAVALLDNGANHFEARQLWPEQEVEPGSTYTLDGSSSCAAWVTRERKCLIIDDAVEEEWPLEGQFPPSTRSSLCVPLYATGRIIGTLNLGAFRNASFSRHDVNVLEEMAPHVAVAIRNAQLLVNLQLSLEAVTRAREKLHAANEELKTLDEMKTNLLSNVSHELRTPLVSVMGYTDMIYNGKAGPVNSVQREYLGISLRNIEKLVTLIENLLDFSRLHRGDEKLIFDTFDLVDCAQSSIQIIKPAADDRSITLTLKTSEEPILVDGDKGKMGQVFNNLLSNAVKFNHDNGHVAVELNTKGDRVEVTVADDGIGMPSEALEKIFTRFYQYDSSSTRKYGGTGIGLSIALDIVRLHGSIISVSSEVGRGSTFRFDLPLAAPKRAIGEPEPTSLSPARETQLLIEIVTSDRSLNNELRHVLVTEGMDLIQTNNGVAACTLARKHHPDCILVEVGEGRPAADFIEPILDDAEVSKVPIVLLTNDDAIYEEYRNNVASRIKRSFRRSTLLGAIHQALGKKLTVVSPAGNKILCVDDDPEVLEFMLRCLENEGFATECCDSGNEAIELAKTGDYGLVLLDIAMPGTDGWDACREIKDIELDGQVLVYLVTAKPISQNVSKIRAAGADGYLLKPFRAEDLVQLVSGLEFPKSTADVSGS